MSNINPAALAIIKAVGIFVGTLLACVILMELWWLVPLALVAIAYRPLKRLLQRSGWTATDEGAEERKALKELRRAMEKEEGEK